MSGVVLIPMPRPGKTRRKRLSRRRIKAKALRGAFIPWFWIVEHRLENWGEWERRYDFMDAYQNVRRHRNSTPIIYEKGT